MAKNGRLPSAEKLPLPHKVAMHIVEFNALICKAHASGLSEYVGRIAALEAHYYWPHQRRERPMTKGECFTTSLFRYQRRRGTMYPWILFWGCGLNGTMIPSSWPILEDGTLHSSRRTTCWCRYPPSIVDAAQESIGEQNVDKIQMAKEGKKCSTPL